MGQLECKFIREHATEIYGEEGYILISGQLGVFLCMRCAALHRKLGTHITKVKSLSMDSWSNDQVDVCYY
jgi:hypothetical protein